MKIAVCSKSEGLESLSDERFGRCENFVIYDTESKEDFTINNDAKNEGAGAGGKAVKILSQNKVDIVIAPELGPKAIDAVKAFEITAYKIDAMSTVKELLAKFSEGKLVKFETSSVASHSGMRRV